MIRAIGPYHLVRRLGRGGMAEVHLAIAHGASGFERRVAIKLLAPELAGEHELERALIREATLAATLHHRNLVAVLGLGVHEGSYYVVMEHVDGGDLAHHLDGPMPEPLALHVVHELALGLGYLHAATDAHGLPLGIVHRDVGPANTLVSTTGDVKLGDFGIAKATALADLTAAGARKGRYAYMAPEQLAGEPVTAAADQFGLAVTLVELVTGARPFAGPNETTPWALLEAIRQGPRFHMPPGSSPDAPRVPLEAIRQGSRLDTPVSASQSALAPDLAAIATPAPDAARTLAPDLAAIAARALAFEPAARYAGIEELRRAIAAAQASRPRVTPLDLGAFVAGVRTGMDS